MNPIVFIDTSAWLALINEVDRDHIKAKRIRDKLLAGKKRFLLTDYIIIEIANSLCKVRWRPYAVKLIISIQQTEYIEIIKINKDIYEEAWNLYSDRTDKEWSLTDCTSFVVMKKYGIRDAFTSDHHFEQAEFNILIKA